MVELVVVVVVIIEAIVLHNSQDVQYRALERAAMASHSDRRRARRKQCEEAACVLARASEGRPVNTLRLRLAVGLAATFAAAEFAGGHLARSLAVQADAAHLVADVGAFLVALVAASVSGAPATAVCGERCQHTFGHARAEALGSLVSVATTLAVTAALVVEAVRRVAGGSHAAVDARLMAAVALGGVVVNVVLLIILGGHRHIHAAPARAPPAEPAAGATQQQESPRRPPPCAAACCGTAPFRLPTAAPMPSQCQPDDAEAPLLERAADDGPRPESLNLRAAVVHALGDLLQSVGVFAGACVMWAKPTWTIVDPLLTFGFAVVVVVSTYACARDIVDVMMERSPRDIDVAEVSGALAELPGVAGVHDLHVWAVSHGEPILTVHIVPAEGIHASQVLYTVQEWCERAGITHVTVQVEPV